VLANVGADLEVKEGSKVTDISKNTDSTFTISTDTGETFQTKTILISAGSGRRKLVAKNADTLEHKGLTYCASCDGPLFSDMDVVVIGGGNASFYEDASENIGEVQGSKTRYYSTATDPSRDFTSDGPWTIVADGVEVNLDRNGSVYDDDTIFLTKW
jgi:uncharacterized protein YuzB (UPF0349 family)